MVGVALPSQGGPVYHGVALDTHVLVLAPRLQNGVTVVAHRLAHVPEEALGGGTAIVMLYK